jgi:hypothetical protein
MTRQKCVQKCVPGYWGAGASRHRRAYRTIVCCVEWRPTTRQATSAGPYAERGAAERPAGFWVASKELAVHFVAGPAAGGGDTGELPRARDACQAGEQGRTGRQSLATSWGIISLEIRGSKVRWTSWAWWISLAASCGDIQLDIRGCKVRWATWRAMSARP